MNTERITTSFNGLAVLGRPITIDNQLIYAVLYNIQVEKDLLEKGQGRIDDYIAFLAGTERFVKNGGSISDDNMNWYLPDEVHSFLNNPSFQRIVAHLMKGEVKVQKYEFEDFIESYEGETDSDEPRAVINKSLVERYTTIYNNEVETCEK